MRAYSTNGSNATGTANKTLITVIGATTVRPCVYDVVVGSSATPADQATKLGLSRFTAAGTAGNSPTPTPLDPQDVAAIATTGNAHSAEPTYTANQTLLAISMNQRNTYRYVCNPGMEFKGPATAANGLGLQLVTATITSIYDGNVSWFE